MKRRKFIAFLGGAAVAAASAARAQQPAKSRRIGILETVSPSLNASNLEALRRGLRELGYVENQNYILEYRSADGEGGRFPALADELVRLGVDLIVTRGTPAARAAKGATETIPVVMAAIGEPLGMGVVASLARPGGNVTGLSAFVTELAGKRVELLKELRPGNSVAAFFHNMGNPVVPQQWEETTKAAQKLGIEVVLLDVRTRDDIPAAFDMAKARHVDTLLVGIDALIQEHGQLIADLAAKHRLAAIYPSREFVDAGGLMAYGVSYPDLYFRSATFIDRIFHGAKAGDLPVEQPTKLELVINLKAANALGLDVPPALLSRADQVIE
ncbi:MAG TPA: ABC transporter substrate-binding protein [Bradyrhizobium sp.]|nr:ABC transporter substrate-binding protein [Bradyrhizobium sp.]